MPEHTKAELMSEIETSWSKLDTALQRLREAQLTEPKDAEGWAVKDHLTHLAAWERSVVFALQGKPRHEGLGVDEELYLNGNDDEINAAIQKKTASMSAAEALAELRNVHSQMMGLLNNLSDEDLQKPYSHYLPNEPGEPDNKPVLYKIHGNTANHFNEHLGWIQSLIMWT
jgi:hypothetical protein